jgi:hypothetical protein
MKTIKYISLCFVLSLLYACKKENLFDCFKSTGDIVTERRSIEPFTETIIYDNANIIIVQDSLTYIEVEAGKNLLPLITTEIRDGKLVIENNNKCNWVRDFSVPVNVYVHVPALRGLDTFGSGKISTQNTLTVDVFEINSRNTASIQLNIIANEIYSKQHAAFGDNTISGSAGSLFVYNTGQGFCDCSQLTVNDATVISSTTGQTYVNACDDLHAEISYSGNVYYKGAPVISSVITGTGKLIQF